MSTPTTEQLLGGGGKAVKFEAPGDAVEGTVVDKVVNQQTDFKTGEKLYYPRSGDPMWQIIASLETTLREGDEDDGLRKVYFKSGLLKALRDTLREHKLKDIEMGAWIRVIHTGLGVAEGGGNAPKQYVVEYRSPSANVIAGNGMQQAQANVQTGLGGSPVQPNTPPASWNPPQNPPNEPQYRQPAPVTQQSYTVPQQHQTQPGQSAQPQLNPITPEMVEGVIAAHMDPKDVWKGRAIPASPNYPGYQPGPQG